MNEPLSRKAPGDMSSAELIASIRDELEALQQHLRAGEVIAAFELMGADIRTTPSFLTAVHVRLDMLEARLKEANLLL